MAKVLEPQGPSIDFLGESFASGEEFPPHISSLTPFLSLLDIKLVSNLDPTKFIATSFEAIKVILAIACQEASISNANFKMRLLRAILRLS
jgi:hypothetical protein